MATSLNASLNVSLNPQSLNQSTKQIQQALGRITGQASEFQKSLDASTARVFAFGATTAVLNGVTQSFKKLVSTTIEVEKRLIEINSIFQATDVQFNKFRNSIFRVAKETGQAFSTVAEGAAELARQGLSAEETATRLKASLVLTRISGLDAEKSVKALTAAINGFASAGLSANQIVNKMVAVDTAFAVSAQDLAEAFSRAGSTAEDAGVSFDQLLGLVTAVEQKTARGGAVIGNAFKSIFTRLQRGTTIEELKELGVQIDASMSGVQKLSALSTAIEGIADPTIVSKIKELAGGVFQINVVSAALKDLGSDTSIFQKAAVTASQATNEAFEKNQALNQSLAAQINVLVQGLTSLAEKVGKITFGPILENLVSIATKFTEFLDKALDPEKGNAFIKGIFKAMGAFLGGPAIVLVTAAFMKIAKLVAKFAVEGLKSLFAMGTQAERIRNVEAGIVDLLGKDAALRKVLLNTTSTQAQREQAVIAAIQRENALLTQQAALMRQIATFAASRGVTGVTQSGVFTQGRKGKPFAVGGKVTGGSGTKDDVPAMLTAGEFVMQKSAVNKFGQPFMEDINQGRLGFNRGGFVPNYASSFMIGNNRFSASQIPAAIKSGKITKEQAATAGYKKGAKKRAYGSGFNVYNANQGTKAVMLIPQVMKFDQDAASVNPFQEARRRKTGFKGFIGGVAGINPNMKRDDPSFARMLRMDSILDASMARGVNNAMDITTKKMGGKLKMRPKRYGVKDIKQRVLAEGGAGAFGALRGAVFEAIINAVQGGVKAGSGNNTLDVKIAGNQIIEKIFGISGSGFSWGDFKNSAAGKGRFSEQVMRSIPKKELAFKGIKKAKGGIIPNYNARRGYGVPASQVRVHLDKNKRPFAVTNTQDEQENSLMERLALDDAIGRERAGIPMARGGFVPNYKRKKGSGGGGSEAAGGIFNNVLTYLLLFGGGVGTATAIVDESTMALEAEKEARMENIFASERDFETRQKLVRALEDEIRARKQEAKGGPIKSAMSSENAMLALMTISTALPIGKALKNSERLGNFGKSVAGSKVGQGVSAGASRVGGFFNTATPERINARLAQMRAPRFETNSLGQRVRVSGISDMDKARRSATRGAALKGQIRGAGTVGAIVGAVELLPKLMSDSLTKQEKIIAGAKTGGGVAGGILGAAGAGALAGTVVGGPLGTIGGLVVGLIGGTIGAMLGSGAAGKGAEAVMGEDKEIAPAVRRQMTQNNLVGGAVKRATTLGFSDDEFNKRINETLGTINANEGIEAMMAAQKEITDAQKEYADTLNAHINNADPEKEGELLKARQIAEEKLIQMMMKKLQAEGRTPEERAQFHQRMAELEARQLELTAKANQAQEEITNALQETETALRNAERDTASKVGLNAGLTGRFSGAVAGANLFEQERVGMARAKDAKNILERQFAKFQQANRGVMDPHNFKVASDEFKKKIAEAGANFDDKVAASATRLVNSMRKMRAKIADLRDDRKELVAEEQDKRASFGAQFAGNQFGEGVSATMLKSHMDMLKEVFSDPKSSMFDKEQASRQFDTQGLGDAIDVIRALGSPELASNFQEFRRELGKANMEKAGFTDQQFEALMENTGVLNTKAIEEIDEEIQETEKALEQAQKAYNKLATDANTANIAVKLKAMGDAMDNAANSFTGVTDYVSAQTKAAEKVNEVVKKNNQIVKDAQEIQGKILTELAQVKLDIENLKPK